MKKRGFLRLFLKIICGLLLLFTMVLIMLLWNGNKVRTPINASSKLLDELSNTVSSGGEVVMTKNDINYLIALLIPNGIERNNLKIKGIYTEIVDKKMLFEIPIRYGGINAILSSKAEIEFQKYKDNFKVLIKPTKFKIGLLPIPKGIVMKLIKNIGKRSIIVNNNTIAVMKDIKILHIKYIAMETNSIRLGLEKINVGQENITIYKKNNNVKMSINKNDTKTESNKVRTKNPVTKNNVRISILRKASRQLSVAANGVNSASEKNIILFARSTINKMILNSSYNYKSDLLKVSAQYDSLTPIEKSKVKEAIQKNVDVNALLKIYSKK